ncbi:MAG: SIS domain-containing protein [Synergistaceae bacterium]|jgi:6-phospho-3-hexuloisomerase|nr:SIS domain-containing protein [Synergistaceae bacterium]
MDYKTMYEEITRAIVEEHRQVFERLDMEQLKVFVRAIVDAKRIFVMGAGREGISCRGFAMRLAHLGKSAHWLWDDTAVAMGPGDLFIVSDGRGDIGMFDYVLNRAKQTGARIAMLTGLPEGKSAVRYADIVLFVHSTVYMGETGNDPNAPVQHDVAPTNQPMGNQYEQHLYMLLDVVAIFAMREMGQTYEEMETRHRNIE